MWLLRLLPRIAFVANVLGDLLLCPKYGAFGAAVATDVATCRGGILKLCNVARALFLCKGANFS